MPPDIEIEYKYPTNDLETVRQALLGLGASVNRQSKQSDEYLNDPLRDFAKVDLALRIRQSNDQYFVTFKGPNLDPAAKIRTEIETPLADAAAAEKIKQTFLGIGFHSVAAVAKIRDSMTLEWQSQQVKICLDCVAEVGDFVELEIVVADRNQKENAKAALESLANELGLTGSIRTSYLELLLRNRGDY